MIQPILLRSLNEWNQLMGLLPALDKPLQRLCEALLSRWDIGGKALLAGNGGSAADAMHFAEELVVRFHKNRKALAAIALCDPTVLTCAGNDFGYDVVFSRQVEALGNAGDLFIAFSTSGNSPSILRALEAAKGRGMITVAFLGKGGGRARGMSDIELLVPSEVTHRVQEAHQLLFHTVCEWVDAKVGQ
jgi:D-sedoheptulose 7-phosphate isomerase